MIILREISVVKPIVKWTSLVTRPRTRETNSRLSNNQNTFFLFFARQPFPCSRSEAITVVQRRFPTQSLPGSSLSSPYEVRQMEISLTEMNGLLFSTLDWNSGNDRTLGHLRHRRSRPLLLLLMRNEHGLQAPLYVPKFISHERMAISLPTIRDSLISTWFEIWRRLIREKVWMVQLVDIWHRMLLDMLGFGRLVFYL